MPVSSIDHICGDPGSSLVMVSDRTMIYVAHITRGLVFPLLRVVIRAAGQLLSKIR
jgi:hypothetical protein